jgi:hypothetical protein
LTSERHHSRKAGEEIHGTAVLANPAGNRELRFHFIQHAPKVRRPNGSDDRAAFVACDVGFFAAADRGNASTAIRIAKVRVGRESDIRFPRPESIATELHDDPGALTPA